MIQRKQKAYQKIGRQEKSKSIFYIPCFINCNHGNSLFINPSTLFEQEYFSCEGLLESLYLELVSEVLYPIFH